MELSEFLGQEDSQLQISTKLYLHGNNLELQLDDITLNIFTDKLKKCQNLKYLSLSNTNFGKLPHGYVKQIAEACTSLHNLISLDLSWNSLQYFTMQHTQTLISSLTNCKNIQYINFSCNSLSALKKYHLQKFAKISSVKGSSYIEVTGNNLEDTNSDNKECIIINRDYDGEQKIMSRKLPSQLKF